LIFNAFAGSIAGLAAVTICYPTDVVRRLMQMSGCVAGHKYDNTLDAFAQQFKREGLRGFYKGYQATVMKTLPMTAMLFVLNEQLKKVFSIY